MCPAHLPRGLFGGRVVGRLSVGFGIEESALGTRAGVLDRLSCTNRRIEAMLVTATPELRQYVMDHGGSLFVHCQRRGIPFLLATTKEPRSLAGYEVFVVEDMLVLTRLPVRRRPEELHMSLEGRRRKRPVASWDGCAYVI